MVVVKKIFWRTNMMENGKFKVRGRILSNVDVNQIIEMVEQ